MPKLFHLVSLLALTAPALADIQVEFREGAPKDRFLITNAGTCALPAFDLVIDLTGTAGHLIFDTTGQGAGVEVFQPFVVEEGRQWLTALPQVKDGDHVLTLGLTDLPQAARLIASTDLDDTVGQREITVRDDELSGARLTALGPWGQVETVIEGGSTARLPLPC